MPRAYQRGVRLKRRFWIPAKRKKSDPRIKNP